MKSHYYRLIASTFITLFIISACASADAGQIATPTQSISVEQITPPSAVTPHNTPTQQETSPSNSTESYPYPPTTANKDKPNSPTEDPYPAPITNPDTANPQEESLELVQSLSISEPQRLVWNQDTTEFALIGYDTLIYYAYPSLNELYRYKSTDSVILLDAASDGVHFAVAPDNETIEIINWKTGEKTTYQVDFGFMAAKFSPDNSQLLFTLMNERAVILMNIQDGQIISKLDGFETAAPVYDARFAADGEHLLWFARATLQISDIETNTMGQSFNHEDFIAGFASNPQHTILATSAGAMENDEFKPFVFYWNPQSGELMNKLELTQPAYSITFSPDGNTIALSQMGNISLISANTPTIQSSYSAHQEMISQLVFSPDGKLLSSIGSDQVINFWRIH